MRSIVAFDLPNHGLPCNQVMRTNESTRRITVVDYEIFSTRSGISRGVRGEKAYDSKAVFLVIFRIAFVQRLQFFGLCSVNSPCKRIDYSAIDPLKIGNIFPSIKIVFVWESTC